ncbi:hypothetical protein LQ327_31925 [Actinomycetospora endophytica]|uniref:Uncharacterized protein n=1 Tax=Actinomycetospora endophytica TaxID=2291215 RepID=A0ABS8PIJ6_9PSEU|nr:hypothetical protein [Actinomycetospora endophytica]MCD2197989.1 hypothetical protein [Actinomycetospora endophytica]
MNTFTRLVAGTLGAGVLAVTGAGLASAAPTAAPAPTDPGHLTPEPGGTQTYLLDGVAVPLPEGTLGVPEALRAAVTPLALLSDASGESAPENAPQSAADAPGASQPSSGSGGY